MTRITVTLEDEEAKRLDALARSTGRLGSDLAHDALRDYLAVQEWQIAGIETALDDVEAHGPATAEEVRATFTRLESGRR